MARHDPSKSRVTPKGTQPVAAKGPAAASPSGISRTPVSIDTPSARWVAPLMFVLLGVGVLVILLNYLNALPGAPSNWYLLGGLTAVLGGIISATQLR